MKNIETTLEKMDKCVLNSLVFLDNKIVYVSIIFILFLYNSCLFSNINKFGSNVYEHSVVKVIVLLLIIYVSRKSTLIGILLALSFVISLTYNSIMEHFVSGYNSHENSFAEVNNEMNESFTEKNKNMQEENMNHSNMEHSNMEHTNMEHSNMEQNEESKESFSNNLFMNERRETESNEPSKTDCLNNYMPKYEGLSNLCNTVSTYKDSLDAQGLNHLNGYEKQDGYLIK